MQGLSAALSATLAVAAIALIATVMSISLPQSTQASPAISQQTGKGCPVCHTAPPALNAAGKRYKETGKL